LENLEVVIPGSRKEQRRIADVLDTVDAAIQETDAVVEKQERVKTGLLQDLLTRGLDAEGRLRDPEREPEAFRETELGIFPQMWRIMTVEEVAESAIDGPFGSKLKTEHYVDQPGVRVVRLQNIGNGIFDDSDKAYVSREHARSLKRHEVLSGDLLVASLGDETHPVGRACQYPDGHSPAINKADCFRVRVREEVAHPRFVMHLLNCPDTRKDIGGLVQGVTRDRINLTNLKRVRLPIPPKDEQVRIVNRLRSESNHIAAEGTYRSKLQSLKTGLMQDLLTGRVRVPEAEDRVDEVTA
jgi:type I restriction enzyme S subunit